MSVLVCVNKDSIYIITVISIKKYGVKYCHKRQQCAEMNTLRIIIYIID